MVVLLHREDAEVKESQRAGEADNAVFRRAIGADIGIALQPGGGRDVDDARALAAAAMEHETPGK